MTTSTQPITGQMQQWADTILDNLTHHGHTAVLVEWLMFVNVLRCKEIKIALDPETRAVVNSEVILHTP